MNADGAPPLLAELTTMRVGGPATDVRRPASEAELVDAVRGAWADASGDVEEDEAGWLVLGGGSNVVAPDAGLETPVVLTGGVRGVTPMGGPGRLRIAAGEPWDDVVAFAVAHGLAGIEALSGIPGSAGAAPVQNIGAYGQELSETLVAIEFLDAERDELVRVDASDLGLGYRTSAIKRGRRGVVTAIELALREDRDGVVAYEQLAAALDVPLGARVPLADIRAAVLEVRRAKGMLDDGTLPSCGSFFVNPIVDDAFARGLPFEAPRWDVDGDEPPTVTPLGAPPPQREFRGRKRVKLSAAWLIERAGVRRGFRLPGSGAAISPLHTLAIVNTGTATAADVVELASYVQLRVAADFAINLQPEPRILAAR